MASALQLIVQIDRFRDGSRRVVNVTEVLGMEAEVISLQDIFRYDHAQGRLVATGIRPEFCDRLRERGIELAATWSGDVGWGR